MRRPLFLLLGCLLISPAAFAARYEPRAMLWPEPHRAFLLDGPGWLLESPERRELLELDSDLAREEWIAGRLEDPIPSTPENELVEGIRRRRQLVRQEALSYLDDRARLLFLQGAPDERTVVDCGWVFGPLELWRYGDATLVLHEVRPDAPWRLWLPIDGKRALYSETMADYLDQMEQRGRGRRWDLRLCPKAKLVDDATGIEALSQEREGRPTTSALQRWISAPEERVSWARRAAVTPLAASAPPELAIEDLRVEFPRRQGQRIVSRFTVTLAPGADLGVWEEGRVSRHDLGLEGRLEEEREIFDAFRIRFRPEAAAEPAPLGLVAETPLRPGQRFVLRLRLEDRLGEGRIWRSIAFEVPDKPQSGLSPPSPRVAQGETMEATPALERDALVLVPPPDDVVLGVWRAVAMVTGERIDRVVFSVDGEAQLSRTQPPFTAEVRLSSFPTEQVVRAEGFDRRGVSVAHDQVVVNRPRGALRVRIVEPDPRRLVPGTGRARAEIVVPDEREVESVEFRLDGDVLARLEQPPWQTQVEIPAEAAEGDVSYLTVVAELDDGSRAEDVLFLSSTRFQEEVTVDLVELYTTVQKTGGGMVRDLEADDFEVREDGRRVSLSRFALVDDLPLMAGIVLDLSGSMANSLVEAERAAVEFLREVITVEDRCFALGFADRPSMLMPPTNDVDAVAFSLEGLQAFGNTSLYDALVHALYYFRHAEGRGALVLLSDGDDTSSYLSFDEALEYARRSGVVVYTVALDVGALDLPLRTKLGSLARDTGGRTFFIDDAAELDGVYRQIEEELRSQYLLAYHSERIDDGTFRTVEVEVTRPGLKARTARGTY